MDKKTLIIQMKDNTDKNIILSLEDPVDNLQGSAIKQVTDMLNTKTILENKPISIEKVYVRTTRTEDISMA